MRSKLWMFLLLVTGQIPVCVLVCVLWGLAGSSRDTQGGGWRMAAVCAGTGASWLLLTLAGWQEDVLDQLCG